jgi:hypothetical protein
MQLKEATVVYRENRIKHIKWKLKQMIHKVISLLCRVKTDNNTLNTKCTIQEQINSTVLYCTVLYCTSI